jgi:hypothetical protein
MEHHTTIGSKGSNTKAQRQGITTNAPNCLTKPHPRRSLQRISKGHDLTLCQLEPAVSDSTQYETIFSFDIADITNRTGSMSIEPTSASSSSSSFAETLPQDIPLEECPICLERFADSMVKRSEADEEEKHEENEVVEIRNQKTNNDDDDDGTRSMHYRLAKERLFIPNCRHQFCRECLIHHCQHSISTRAIPIVCPEASAQCHCATVLPDDLVKDLLLRRWASSSKNTSTTRSTRSGSSCSSTSCPTMDLGQSDEDEPSPQPPSFAAADFPKHPHEEWIESQKQQKQQQQQNSTRSEEENATATASETSTTTTTVPITDPTNASTTDTVVAAMAQEGGDGVFWLEPSSSPDWLKYQRFQRMLQDPSLIPCTHCQELLCPPSLPPPLALQESETNAEFSFSENDCPTQQQELEPPPSPRQEAEAETHAEVSSSEHDFMTSPQEHNHHNQQQPEKMNQLTCHSCGHVFCRIHGDSHPPQMSCEEYEQSTDARQVKKSEKAIRNFTKPCSHCGAPIQKESGCDFMICGSCRKEMCFKCGTHVHLSGSSGDMRRFCTQCNQQYIDDRHPGTGLILCFVALCYVPVNLLYVFIMGVLAIVTCGCGCCFGCGTFIQPKGDGTGVVSIVSHRGGGTTTTTTTTGRRSGRGRGATNSLRNTTTTDSDNDDKNSPGASGLALATPTGNNTMTTTTAKEEEKKKKKKRAFQPLEGIRLVFIMIFYPFMLCCLVCHMPETVASNAFQGHENDEDDDDDDFGDNVHRDMEAGLAAVVTL